MALGRGFPFRFRRIDLPGMPALGLAAVMTALGCDASNPVAPVGVGEPAPATSYTVSISASPSSAFAGSTDAVPISVSVIDNETGGPPSGALEATVSTTLGTFVEGGALVTVTLPGGEQTVNLLPGDVAGMAEILARLDDSAGSLTFEIKDPGEPPEADFEFTATELDVIFIDTSTGDPTAWEWDFGDGSALSEERDPAHTYEAPGDYRVRFTATNIGGSGTTAKFVQVNLFPVADFTWCTAGSNTVTFTSTATGGSLTYDWTFGDGETLSGDFPSVTHTYAGTSISVSVNLTVSNTEGSSSVTHLVRINDSNNLCI